MWPRRPIREAGRAFSASTADPFSHRLSVDSRADQLLARSPSQSPVAFDYQGSTPRRRPRQAVQVHPRFLLGRFGCLATSRYLAENPDEQLTFWGRRPEPSQLAAPARSAGVRLFCEMCSSRSRAKRGCAAILRDVLLPLPREARVCGYFARCAPAAPARSAGVRLFVTRALARRGATRRDARTRTTPWRQQAPRLPTSRRAARALRNHSRRT